MTESISFYVLAKSIILRAEAAMLLVVVKPLGTWKSGFRNIKEYPLELVNI